MGEIIYREESFKIIGACFEVYNQKGFGFTEPIYQECLQLEFLLQEVPCVAKPKIPMMYKDRLLNHHFQPDFVCYEKIILEIKAVGALTDAHRAQTLNYLYAMNLDLGLLVNFGQFPKLIYERLANNKRNSAARSVYEVMASRIESLD
jgi:GxxExxY protein